MLEQSFKYLPYEGTHIPMSLGNVWSSATELPDLKHTVLLFELLKYTSGLALLIAILSSVQVEV